MTRLLHNQIKHAAQRRPAGFLAAIHAKAVVHPAYIEINREDLEAINREFPVVAQKVIPAGQMPPVNISTKVKTVQKWPKSPFGLVAQAIKLMRTPEDNGVGDTIARVIGPVGGDAYKQWFLDTFGKSCGCTERQENLNETFPYEKTP